LAQAGACVGFPPACPSSPWMPPSSRARPFAFTFHPYGLDCVNVPKQSPWVKQKVIPINPFAPIEIENDHFKGRLMLIHDTGNEVGLEVEEEVAGDVDPDTKRRGVIFQMQGMFKKAASDGEQGGVWIGGSLPQNIKLGWIMQNVVGVCVKYVKKKTEGRSHIIVGDKGPLKPHLTFPLSQLFTIIDTPPGEEPPRLGTSDFANVKWQGPAQLKVVPTHTYSFSWKSPYLDCCSWELLNVPGVSPLPIEKIIGDMSSAHLMMYDLGVAGGSHLDWRKGSLLEFHFSRMAAGESWLEDDVGGGVMTPLGEESESEASEVEDVLVDDGEDQSSDDDGSESSEDLADEDDEALSLAESQALDEIEGWRPRLSVNGDSNLKTSVNVPYYIEAIDRRRGHRVRVWYVFWLRDPERENDWWTAKSISELASLCRRRPNLHAFRRRRGATRGCTCYGVQTLEQFRQVVRKHLDSNTKLRNIVIGNTATDLLHSKPPFDRDCAPQDNPAEEIKSEAASTTISRHQSPSPKEVRSGSSMAGSTAGSMAQLPNVAAAHVYQLSRTVKPLIIEKGAKIKRRRNKVPPMPPRFFVDTGSTVELAFAAAREGRWGLVREALVGAVHFEGRLCEELLRLSKDGMLRCFLPHDCDKPRLRLSVSQILAAHKVDRLFLGRFHAFEVHTLLQVFTFCTADEVERDEWVSKLTPTTAGTVPPSKSMVQNVVAFGDTRALLMDLTRAKRWRPSKRLVVNDRVLLKEADTVRSPRVVEGMLEQIINFPDPPSMSDLVSFTDLTCVLKAVCFDGWSQSDLIAFWLNVYHCLLLHGRHLFGMPKSRTELERFYGRVSYLVGLRPVSLKEIEINILRVPIADLLAPRTSGRARCGQFFAVCCFCARRQKRGASSYRARDTGSKGGSGTHSPVSSGSTTPTRQHGKRISKSSESESGKCLPQPKIPLPKIRMQGLFRQNRAHVCLFLGWSPEDPAKSQPAQDLRVALCLNRGNQSSLAGIPMFNAACIGDQLNDVARAFVAEYVRVKFKDGAPTSVTLPHCCRGVKRALINDPQKLLSLVWQFLPGQAENKTPPPIGFNFLKHHPDPRPLSELSKFRYSNSVLEVPPALSAHCGPELEVVAGAALACTELAGTDSVQVRVNDMAGPSLGSSGVQLSPCLSKSSL